jgi:hypothetical protein
MNIPDLPTDGIDLADILRLYGCSIEQFSALVDVHPRTVRRWLAGESVPVLVQLVAWFVVAGHVPRTGWHGWRFDMAGALWGDQARATRYAGLNPEQLSEFGLLLGFWHDAQRLSHDLMAENDRLRGMVLAARIKAELPGNVALFPGVSAESVINSKKEGSI